LAGLEQLGEDRLFVAEVVVDRALAGLGHPGDLVDGRRVETIGDEQRLSSTEHRFTRQRGIYRAERVHVAITQDELIAGIAEIIEEVTGIEPSEVTVEKSFVDDLDIDSLSMVEIAVQTEDKYGVKIPDEDLAGLRTVGDVVGYLQQLATDNPEAAEAIRAQFDKRDE
jgi:acyl carrier protein